MISCDGNRCHLAHYKHDFLTQFQLLPPLAKSTLKVCRIQEADPSHFACTANTGYGSDSIDFEMNVQSIGGMFSVNKSMSQVKCGVIRLFASINFS